MKPAGKILVFTGGGTFGHVGPNLALLARLQPRGWQAHYIGSKAGIERNVIARQGLPYHAIASGKLRRYFSWQNLADVFRVLAGIVQATFAIRKIRPAIIFSKGGYVSLPVVVGGWLNRVPVIVHESDLTPGLTTRLSAPFAHTICVAFAPTAAHFPNRHVVHTGLPVREQLLRGNRERGLALCRFSGDRPSILVIGGSLGSQVVNNAVRQALPGLLPEFNVAHICGKGNIDAAVVHEGYCQFEYVDTELPDVLAAADMVISRAGATSLFELLTLRKPHLLIPLSRKASRGDQIENARYLEQAGISAVLQEEHLQPDVLLRTLRDLLARRDSFLRNMEAFTLPDATAMIVDLIEKNSK